MKATKAHRPADHTVTKENRTVTSLHNFSSFPNLRGGHRVIPRLALLALLATTAFLLVAGPAAAASPWWHLTSGFRPAVLSSTPGAKGEVVLYAANLGDGPADAEADPIVIEDQLPPGLEPRAVPEAVAGANGGSAGPVICQKAPLRCTFDGVLGPYARIEVRIKVKVSPGSAGAGEINEATISGGEAPPAQASRSLALGEGPPPFGVEAYEPALEEPGGAADTRAGSHPYQFTTTLNLNQNSDFSPAAIAKDLSFELPPGFVGNATAYPRCTLAQFTTIVEGASQCPAATVIGVALVNYQELPSTSLPSEATTPVFNLEPAFGEPARFAFAPITATPVFIGTSVRSASDYGITARVQNVPQLIGFLGSTVTIWGVPGDSRHDAVRGSACLTEAQGETPQAPCLRLGQSSPLPFLTQPTSCSGGPLSSSVTVDSWLEPATLLTSAAGPPLPTLDGCNQLPFSPTIEAKPSSNAATSPTGLDFDLKVADQGLTAANGRAQSQVKRAVVTLPAGFTTNPSVAEGLHDCSLAQYESETVNSDPGTGCPENSKIGDVEIESPLVAPVVHGSLFVAKQHENPYDNLLTLYLVAKNPELGIIVKQALEVTPNPVTGQLTTEVDNIPQLPFSRFHLSFRQGQRSPLITPPTCGTYTVTADLYPYSEPSAPVHREGSFEITQGSEGQPCPSGGVPPFHPNLLAGSENPTAGAYSPFYTEITRRDSEQEITRFSIKLPPGVIGKLAGVGECSDAQIAAAKAREREGGGGEEEAAPSCPAASQIGHSNVGSGVGNVLAYAPGKLYLAGPYHGSNLSIVSITAAKVGPFDLGTVVVRFALKIDPETAEVSVDGATSDPIPHIVDGIPVHLRDIQAFVDRPDFTLNPTSCAKKSTASTILGSGLNFASEADDQPVTITSPFQVGSCASLGFKPKLALSLKGGTHRGATPAFKAVLTYPKGAYANTKSSQVTLPHSEFLEQAHIGTVCTRVQFAAGAGNGSACPPASIYGRAKAVTPVLEEPVKGPVILRSSSHNLPDLVLALHNRQVDFNAVGRIDSVRNGRIRNTFEAIPDVPLSSVTLEMQGGKKGLLVNSTNLCKGTNRAISDFTAQNGKVSNTNPVLKAKCGGKGKKKGKGKHRG